MSRDEIESSYKISRRIEGEERALDVAMMVFTSTQQEVRPLGCPLITEG
jgi:sucrose-phosphate synthase